MIPFPGFESSETARSQRPIVAPSESNEFNESSESTTAPEPAASTEPNLHAVVTRSARRKRSVGWSLKGDAVHITIPSWMSAAEEARWTDQIMARMRRKHSSSRVDLRERATELARKYDLPRPREIKWADDMTTRWGSCTSATSTVRISNRIASFPTWVIDYVIVHEIAHIREPNHSPAFWQLVHRYPKAERATGYLIAKAGDAETEWD